MTKSRDNWHLAALLLILLAAALLRFRGIDPMHTMLHHDEAYYGLDALSLLDNPRLTTFFPNNTGRESLWMYLLTPSLAAFGATPFALRIVTMFVGLLTVAAMVPFARELIGKRGALWAAAAYAVLYWAVHMHHIAFRTNLFPLVGIIALTCLLRAYRKNRLHLWLWTGLASGLLLYTYTAARGWVAYIGLTLLLLAFFSVRRRRGALLAAGICGVLCLPLAINALTQPLIGVEGLSRTAATDLQAVVDNVVRWLGAWLHEGDTFDARNLNAQPILNLPLALLAVLGLLTIWRYLWPAWLWMWSVGLALLALLPSILTVNAPHYVRGTGIIPLTALVIGAGAFWLENHKRWRHYLTPLVVLLFVWSGADTLTDFNQWLRERRLLLYIDDRMNFAMAAVREQTAPDMPIYIAGLDYHPVAAFHAADMPQRHSEFYQFPDGSCFITPNQTTVFMDLPIVLNSFTQRVAAFADDVAVLAADYAAPHILWQVVQVTPRAEIISAWDDEQTAMLGDMLQIKLVQPLPQAVRRGATLQLQVGMRLLRHVPEQYHLFLHLQGDPTPYEGGRLWSTGDGRLCAEITSTDRLRITEQANLRDAETVVQTFSLSIPADLPAGDYHVAVGLYDFDTGQRLPLTVGGEAAQYYELARFTLAHKVTTQPSPQTPLPNVPLALGEGL